MTSMGEEEQGMQSKVRLEVKADNEVNFVWQFDPPFLIKTVKIKPEQSSATHNLQDNTIIRLEERAHQLYPL